MWAAILSFLSSITGIAKILDIINSWIREVMPTTQDKIDSDRDKLEEEQRRADETGRPQ